MLASSNHSVGSSESSNDVSFRSLASDYFELMKPRVMILVVFTALVGMVFGTAQLDFIIASVALFAIAVGAGASAAFNMAAEADIDAHMRRTCNRPVAAGRISRSEAEQFGLLLSVLSITLLGFAANWLAAILLAFTITFYGFYYTRYLKPTTPQNIVIGGLAGALPPLIGAVAVTGSVNLPSFVLLILIFFWTPPHFWALALISREDYKKVGIPMLPNTHGLTATIRQMKIYGWLCLFVSCLPLFLSFASTLYLAVCCIMNGLFITSLYLIKLDDTPLGLSRKAALRAFFISILYLFLLFLALLIEQLLAMKPIFGGLL